MGVAVTPAPTQGWTGWTPGPTRPRV